MGTKCRKNPQGEEINAGQKLKEDKSTGEAIKEGKVKMFIFLFKLFQKLFP